MQLFKIYYDASCEAYWAEDEEDLRFILINKENSPYLLINGHLHYEWDEMYREPVEIEICYPRRGQCIFKIQH